MTKSVLDASALLAVLFAETGAEAVIPLLQTAVISAVNYTEVLARAAERGTPPGELAAAVRRLELGVIPFDAQHAAVTASLRPATKPFGLSLADRACLALGLITASTVLTADRAWVKFNLGVRVELIR